MFIFTVHYRNVHAVKRVEGGITLPRSGYFTFCVSEEVYNRLRTNAKKTNCSMPEYIRHLIEMEKARKGEPEVPLEIAQADQRVAEVRFTCDRCGSLLGIQIMPKEQVETQTAAETVCKPCKCAAQK